MKKILALLFIPALCLILCILPVVFKFTEFLFILDNTDFGIPLWLDLLIDLIAGVIAFVLTRLICGALRIQDRESKGTIDNVISIIVGFIIAFVVHIFMKYWIIIVSIISAVIVGLIICLLYIIIKKSKT
ncbi:MAG: hypothetical protein K5765_00565 [Clostridia bacterium]|nr:hypothetical protein [Clostridia bacterium]